MGVLNFEIIRKSKIKRFFIRNSRHRLINTIASKGSYKQYSSLHAQDILGVGMIQTHFAITNPTTSYHYWTEKCRSRFVHSPIYFLVWKKYVSFCIHIACLICCRNSQSLHAEVGRWLPNDNILIMIVIDSFSMNRFTGSPSTGDITHLTAPEHVFMPSCSRFFLYFFHWL